MDLARITTQRQKNIDPRFTKPLRTVTDPHFTRPLPNVIVPRHMRPLLSGIVPRHMERPRIATDLRRTPRQLSAISQTTLRLPPLVALRLPLDARAILQTTPWALAV